MCNIYMKAWLIAMCVTDLMSVELAVAQAARRAPHRHMQGATIDPQ